MTHPHSIHPYLSSLARNPALVHHVSENILRCPSGRRGDVDILEGNVWAWDSRTALNVHNCGIVTEPVLYRSYVLRHLLVSDREVPEKFSKVRLLNCNFDGESVLKVPYQRSVVKECILGSRTYECPPLV